MCEIDAGDSYEVWSETKRRARKEHKCDGCHGRIAPGEAYVVHFSVFEGDPSSAKMCEPCDVTRMAFAEAHQGRIPHPDSLWDTLQECIFEGDDESETRWQPMLDQMMARRTAYHERPTGQ